MNCKECVGGSSWPNSDCYPGICLESLGNTCQDFSHIRDSKQASPECKTETLALEPSCLLLSPINFIAIDATYNCVSQIPTGNICRYEVRWSRWSTKSAQFLQFTYPGSASLESPHYRLWDGKFSATETSSSTRTFGNCIWVVRRARLGLVTLPFNVLSPVNVPDHRTALFTG
jgi:hypothetical protein